MHTCSREFCEVAGNCEQLVHRTMCTQANGCAMPNPFRNSCHQGYTPYMYDDFGSMTVDCTTYCKPAECFPGVGNCGATPGANLIGAAPGHCNNTDRLGIFNPATEGGNGDHCAFSWRYAIDQMGQFVLDPAGTGDSVGYCFDHTKLRWDSDNNGMVEMSDNVWPRCDDMLMGGTNCGSGKNQPCAATDITGLAPAIMGTEGTIGAGFMGCVNHTRAGVMAQGKPVHVIAQTPRLPYYRSVRQ
jgi:hypothetical protein